jgi:predicted Rossmann fold flavoprotein
MNTTLKTEIVDIAVCGAGPSGLMAAIEASINGKSVVVFEQLSKPARKLLSTGGGRCNISNHLPANELIESYHGQHGFVKPAFKTFSSKNLITFFSSHGLELHSPDGKHIYPVSEKAGDVLNCLLNICNKQHISINTSSTVESLVKNEDGIFTLTVNNRYSTSRNVILASGGISYPSLGGTGGGYSLAKKLGHSIVNPIGALAGLLCSDSWVGNCAGLTLDSAVVYIQLPEFIKKKISGSVLFTHKGISGPAALNISRYISRLLLSVKRVPLRIRILPDISREMWAEFFIYCQQKEGKKLLKTLLTEKIPSRLTSQLFILASVPETVRAADLNKTDKGKLLELLSDGIPVYVTNVDSLDKSMVTTGGVDCTEVNANTMESKLVKGLFFCGELLDIDGPCGGYNLQWAFSSGFLAGKSASKVV